MEERQPPRCTHCRRKLEQGMDVLSMTKSVIGPRGSVPLEEPLLFCQEACVVGYMDSSDEPLERLP